MCAAAIKYKRVFRCVQPSRKNARSHDDVKIHEFCKQYVEGGNVFLYGISSRIELFLSCFLGKGWQF